MYFKICHKSYYKSNDNWIASRSYPFEIYNIHFSIPSLTGMSERTSSLCLIHFIPISWLLIIVCSQIHMHSVEPLARVINSSSKKNKNDGHDGGDPDCHKSDTNIQHNSKCHHFHHHFQHSPHYVWYNAITSYSFSLGFSCTI